MKNEIKKCPVCKTEVLKQGLKNHITGRAHSEAFKQMKGLFTGKGREIKFSRIVVLRNNPHFKFYYKNAKQMPDNEFSLKYTIL